MTAILGNASITGSTGDGGPTSLRAFESDPPPFTRSPPLSEQAAGGAARIVSPSDFGPPSATDTPAPSALPL
jgi:hypothetical protein